MRTPLLLLGSLATVLATAGPAAAAKHDTTWTGAGTGAVKVVATGADADPRIDYLAEGAYNGSWIQSATAGSTRNLPLKWEATGFWGWFEVQVQVERFVQRGGVEVLKEQLISTPKTNCCSAPSGGFTYTGSTTFILQKGDIYGFRVRGSHFTGGPVMTGSMIVKEVDDSAPEVTATVTGEKTESGYYTGPVGVKWASSDPDSRISARKGCEDASVVEDTAGKTITCAVTSAGGTTTKSVTIKRDTTAPELTVPPTAVQPTPSAAGGAVAYKTSATDAVDPNPVITCDRPSGSRFPVGTTTVTCTATDAAGNKASKSFDAIVFVAAPSVLPAPAPAQPAALKPINAVLAFQFKIAKQTTRLVQLRVKNVPAGATVTVTCKGKSCPKNLKGAGRTLTSKGSVVSLATLIKTGLKNGTTLNVRISSPGAITSIKTLIVRKGKPPVVR